MPSTLRMGSCCRLCGCTYIALISTLTDPILLEKIRRLYQIIILEEDKLPTVICHPCKDIVDNNWEFYLHVQETQLAFMRESRNELKPNDQNTNKTISKYNKRYSHTNSSATDVGITKSLSNIENVDEYETVFMEIEPQIMTGKGENQNNCDNMNIEKSPENFKKKKLFGINYEENEDGTIIPSHPMDGWTELQWKCYACQNLNIFSTLQSLSVHYEMSHAEQIRFPCMDCVEVADRYDIFIMHMKLHRTMLKCCCDVCGNWFGSRVFLNTHRKEKHPHICGNCGKLYKTAEHLKEHQQLHVVPKLVSSRNYGFQCIKCFKRFRLEGSLRAHRKRHSVKNYSCKLCGTIFFSKIDLRQHSCKINAKSMSNSSFNEVSKMVKLNKIS